MHARKFFNTLLLSWAAVFVLVSLYALHAGKYKVLALFVTAAAGCVITYRLGDEYKIKISLLGLSLIVSLYLAETALFFYNIKFRKSLLAVSDGIDFDTRTKFEVVKDLNNSGTGAYPNILPSDFIALNGLSSGGEPIFPLGGISGATTVLSNEGGRWIIYSSDRYGFNNNDSIYNEGIINVASVGDSFAHGVSVDPRENITGHLIKKGFTAVNFGQSGNGPLLELATLIEYIKPLRPAYVLWTYYEGNDLFEFQNELGSGLLRSYLKDGFTQNLMARQAEIDRLLKDYIKKYTDSEIRSARFKNFVNIVKLRGLRARVLGNNVIRGPDPALLGPFEDIMARAGDICATWGGQLIFVYLTDYKRYAIKQERESLFLRREVLATVRELGIPLVDIHQVFINEKDPLSLFPFREYGHYTSEGYALAAEKIAAKLHELDANSQAAIRKP